MHLTPEALTVFEDFQLQYAQNLGEPLHEPRWGIYKKRLIEDNRDDEFYVQVNMKTNKIIWHHNMDRCLGHNKKQEFDESFFDELIHPFILPYFNAFALGVYSLVLEKKDSLSYMSIRYKITVPLRKADGEYICMRQTTYPCEFDAKRQIVTYFMRYTDNGIYLGQPLQPSIMLDNVVQHDYMVQWYQFTANLMTIGNEKHLFTRDELKVLKEAYKVRFEDKRNELLQKKLLISIKHYNTSIKYKTKLMFIMPLENTPKPDPLRNFHACLPKLNDVYQISEFLHHSHIIQLIESKLRSLVLY